MLQGQQQCSPDKTCWCDRQCVLFRAGHILGVERLVGVLLLRGCEPFHMLAGQVLTEQQNSSSSSGVAVDSACGVACGAFRSVLDSLYSLCAVA